jgi:tetratricopeptide (TPR) repeat protein
MWSCCAMAQSPEEQAIVGVVKLETESYLKGDSTTWKKLFIQDEKTNNTFATKDYYSTFKGWKQLSTNLLGWMRESGKPSRYDSVNMTNLVVTSSDKLATLIYDQHLSSSKSDTLPKRHTREYRTLVKDGNDWKITSLITHDTVSYTSTKPEYVENELNALGYNFLNAKKIDQAIAVFKFNVQMYPNAWNPYDSLAEAYATAGNKKLAIENYRKSVKLNPKNDNGKQMLAKLMK